MLYLFFLLISILFNFFFFSSRRRHTRFDCDWSSDVCSSDLVDVLEHLSPKVHDAIVGEMEPAEAEEVRKLEKYPPDTAGGIMTPEATALDEGLTVQQAVEELRRLSEELEQMFYVYVVDQRRHLVGVLSMRDLILARPDRGLSKIMRTEVAS